MLGVPAFSSHLWTRSWSHLPAAQELREAQRGPSRHTHLLALSGGISAPPKKSERPCEGHQTKHLLALSVDCVPLSAGQRLTRTTNSRAATADRCRRSGKLARTIARKGCGAGHMALRSRCQAFARSLRSALRVCNSGAPWDRPWARTRHHACLLSRFRAGIWEGLKVPYIGSPCG